MLFRLAYLGVTNTLALLRLLPMSARDKDAEILALRHQIMVLEQLLVAALGSYRRCTLPHARRRLGGGAV